MTGFKGVRNENGRPKGAVNKTTAETKELIQKIVSNELENIVERLEQLDNKERLDVIIKLLPYIIPKQNHIGIYPEDDPDKFRPIMINLGSGINPLELDK